VVFTNLPASNVVIGNAGIEYATAIRPSTPAGIRVADDLSIDPPLSTWLHRAQIVVERYLAAIHLRLCPGPFANDGIGWSEDKIPSTVRSSPQR
jgi:hypothetical protein